MIFRDNFSSFTMNLSLANRSRTWWKSWLSRELISVSQLLRYKCMFPKMWLYNCQVPTEYSSCHGVLIMSLLCIFCPTHWKQVWLWALQVMKLYIVIQPPPSYNRKKNPLPPFFFPSGQWHSTCNNIFLCILGGNCQWVVEQIRKAQEKVHKDESEKATSQDG